MKRRTFRAEREFGLIVGAVFSVLGLWWMYRGKFLDVAHVFVVVGAALILSGIVAPRVLVVPRKAWMKLAEGMAFVSSRIILALIFFLVLTPIGLIKRAMGWDPYPPRQQNPRHYEKMF